MHPDALHAVQLQGNADTTFKWLLSLTVCVAVGVSIEIPEAVHEFRIWRQGEPRKRWGPLFSFVGVVIVGLGISGEVLAEYWAQRQETKIRDFENQRLALGAFQVAEAQKQAALANERATNATSVATGAASRASLADQSAATARARAAALSVEAESLRAQNLATEKEVLIANSAVEDERITRLNLEASLAPRPDFPLELWTENGRSVTNLDSMKIFAGQQVWIEYVPEFEARRAASRVRGILAMSGWKVTKFSASQRDLQDGVLVWRCFNMELPGDANASPQAKASLAVTNFLTKYKWEASQQFTAYGLPFGTTSPTSALLIEVGMKPTPYFDEKTRSVIR